ncbi:MAG TPA: hypothetical protein VGC84_07570 [Ilumatobacteraceae bacterium]
MHRSTPSAATRAFVSCAALAALVLLASCGSDAGTATGVGSSTTTTVAPENVKVAPAVVAAGLHKLPATIASAIAAIGTPQAATKVDAIEKEWAGFEGTVRDTDRDLYLSIEDQLDPLQDQIKAGDASAASTTAGKLSDLFSQYLAKHPG